MNGIGPIGSPEVAARLTQALQRTPGDRVARHNLAVELRRLDRGEEALREIERAWDEGLRVAETLTMRGHLFADAGRFDEAEAAYREAIRIKPELVEPAQALAALLPQVGRPAQALDGFRACLAGSPGTGVLWVEAMGAAKAHGDHGQLLEWADAAERHFGRDTLIATFAANALSGLERDEEAHLRLAAALSTEPEFAPGQATLAQILVRLGDYPAAEQAALAATRLAPLDQSGWALLGTIWRLRAEPREDWLCRYDELVMPVEVEVPDAMPDLIERRHLARTNPADQSLRGGTQTSGNLFESADPRIIAFAEHLRDVIEARLAVLPRDDGHPFLSRKRGRIAFSASWSVRLANAGFHISHMHPAGWLSSALYIALPPEVSAATGQGALTFGVPDAALGLDLAPRRVVTPREGLLVLFPSYLWHGTTPFHSEEPRLTVAFDALPIDNAGAQA